MPSMKHIKQRVANVGTTRQIIKAMDMVTSTRLHRARQRLEGVRPLFYEMKKMVETLNSCEEAELHPFAARREIKNTAYVVITSNKGLCGSYNANVVQKALDHMNAGKNEKILVLGSRGNDYFRRMHKKIIYRDMEIADAQIYDSAGQMAGLVASLYLSGEVDEVFVVYTHFESTLSHVPRLERVLPILDDSDRRDGGMNYEPDVGTFIDNMIPLYLHTYLFAASAESVASEYAARMVSMGAAGKNADDIIEDLGRMYNRKRQAAITQEISEIVGGANILR